MREALALTQRQWADYTRVAEKEKARLREVAAIALNDQRLADADAYEAQARCSALIAIKYGCRAIATIAAGLLYCPCCACLTAP